MIILLRSFLDVLEHIVNIGTSPFIRKCLSLLLNCNNQRGSKLNQKVWFSSFCIMMRRFWLVVSDWLFFATVLLVYVLVWRLVWL